MTYMNSIDKKELTPEQHHILREKGTEPAFSGSLLYHKEKGIYTCAGCDEQLFSSDTKFDSGSGWPSFDQAIPDVITRRVDTSHGMTRTEVICRACDGHLGHVFDDGPTQTGERYCINSGALGFAKEDGQA